MTPAVETTEWEKYYYAGAVRLAMREDSDDPLYLIGDHLGSTSLVLDSAGLEVAKQSYLPFGEDWGVGATDLPTDFTFTGQREVAEVGLHYYVARWYDSEIGHFLQGDTIVPTAVQGTQAWNRYQYTNYNPINYTDPNGHWVHVAIGAAIGEIIGGVTYALTNQGESFNGWECAAAVAVGAGAGVAISLGIGIVASATAGVVGASATTGTALVGAGSTMAAESLLYTIGNINKFETDEFLIHASVSAGTGALTTLPGVGPGAKIGIEVFGSTGEYMLTEENRTVEGYGIAITQGIVSGLADNVVDGYFGPYTKAAISPAVDGLDAGVSALGKNLVIGVQNGSLEGISGMGSSLFGYFANYGYQE